MRFLTILTVAIAALFLFTTAQVSLAGGAWSHPASAEPEVSGSTENPMNTGGSALDDWKYQEALETGNLPAGRESRFNESASPSGEEILVIESGGLFYRLRVDTQ